MKLRRRFMIGFASVLSMLGLGGCDAIVEMKYCSEYSYTFVDVPEGEYCDGPITLKERALSTQSLEKVLWVSYL